MIPHAFGHVAGVAGESDASSGGALALVLVVLALATVAATGLVDRSHPRNPIPRRRIAALLIGLGTVAIALVSPLDGLADDAYSWHMIQHLLLTFVAAPLIVLGAPITLAFRASPAGFRRRILVPALHSLPVRVLAHPVVGWLALIVVSWAIHLTPLYAAALEDQGIHELEHALLLASGLLFWSPVVAADPVPWRLDHGARFAFVGLALPLLSLL
ncbi:MAG TPA: cytochrome c oxidase assembly protein, partial [Candidatus Limnocylindrales bacterium]|nr:cytochrome c oxidase assembly protein [Candidatus Limnocylindrales bacterium]